MNEYLVCDACGIGNNKKEIRPYHGMMLCPKHRMQIYRYNKIIDASQRTTHQKNDIIIKENHAEVIIRNNKSEKVCTALIDINDLDLIKQYKWHITNRYIATRINNKEVLMHRMILNYYGDFDIDHINQNKFDNRKSNLRIVKHVINAQNISKLGIYKAPKNKWRVYVKRFGKRYYLGTYKNYDDALKVRNNFVDEFEKQNAKLIDELTLSIPICASG